MKFRKLVICFVSTLVMCGALIGTASAADVDYVQPMISSTSNEISPYAEETTWYVRQNPQTGKWEKRLWSITNEKWLTDWLPIN